MKFISKDFIFVCVVIILVVFVSPKVYADFWDSGELVPVEEIRELNKQKLEETFSENKRTSRGKIDLTLVGFDIERNQRAQDMLNEMAEAARQSGVRGTVLFAGNEDEVELETAMLRALQMSRGYGSQFSNYIVMGVVDSVSFRTTSEKNSLAYIPNQVVSDFSNVFNDMFK